MAISSIGPNPSKAVSRNPASSDADSRQLREAAVEFESLLLDMMMKSMRESVPESGLFGDESHTRMYQEMLDTELSKVMAHQGGLGLAQMIVDQFEGHEEEGLRALRGAGKDVKAAEASYRANSRLSDTGIVPFQSNDEETTR